jgi:Delta24(24(1))-sterol reductase
MVTTRSQSVSPRKKTAQINYADLANPPTPTPTSPRKRSVAPKLSPQKRSTTTTTDSPTKKTPRRKSMAEKTEKPLKDEIVVESEEQKPVELPNGNGVEKRPASRKASRSASGSTEAKVKGKPAHKVDTSGKFEFGGPFGTASMMIFFPMLMYYLWICNTFYGGKLEFKRGSETWLAFADRMVAHVTKVVFQKKSS